MRTIWVDRRKLESRTITLTQALTKIETFRKRMLTSYDLLLDERVPDQRYAKLVMHLLLYRLHVMILHPFYGNTTSVMPARLRSVLIMSGIMIIELAIQLDTDPEFRLWRWYAGAYQQYQAALILATEIYQHPGHKEAGRVWACLDYVFGVNDSMPREEKGRQILMDIMGKMGAYMNMRKMRVPALTADASPAKQAVKAEKITSRPWEEVGSTLMSPVSQQTYPYERSARVPPVPMKEEPDLVSPVAPGPRSGPPYHPYGSGTPTSVSPQQQQQVRPGTGSLPIHSHSQHGAPGSDLGMASYSSGDDVWMPHPLPLNHDSPENSSSDGGSVVGAGQRQGSLGGVGKSIPGGVPPQGMEGEWVWVPVS